MQHLLNVRIFNTDQKEREERCLINIGASSKNKFNIYALVLFETYITNGRLLHWRKQSPQIICYFANMRLASIDTIYVGETDYVKYSMLYEHYNTKIKNKF